MRSIEAKLGARGLSKVLERRCAEPCPKQCFGSLDHRKQQVFERTRLTEGLRPSPFRCRAAQRSFNPEGVFDPQWWQSRSFAADGGKSHEHVPEGQTVTLKTTAEQSPSPRWHMSGTKRRAAAPPARNHPSDPATARNRPRGVRQLWPRARASAGKRLPYALSRVVSRPPANAIILPRNAGWKPRFFIEIASRPLSPAGIQWEDDFGSREDKPPAAAQQRGWGLQNYKTKFAYGALLVPD